MGIPQLSHLQLFVLKLVAEDPHTGKYIRQRLGDEGYRHSLAAFYQLMSRLEEAGLVESWHEAQHISGQTIKEKHYTIRKNGLEELRNAARFYSRHMTVENEAEVSR